MADSPAGEKSGTTDSGSVRWSTTFWIAWVIVLGFALWRESRRWLFPNDDPLSAWWSGQSPDWLPFLPVLLLAIPLWFVRSPLLHRTPRWWLRLRGWGGESCPTSASPTTRREQVRAVMMSLLVAAVGLMMSAHVGRRFGDLPPAFHDEFSYLFQARTFLAGRVSFPSHPEMPELFDQMHVLNEGAFASRYFPGVGLWMAPFVALGNAWWGHRVAHSFAAFLLFWIGRHLGNNAVGLIAGLLLAVSPGVALFSNLLLSHHPTLVGLLVFVSTFLKLRRAIAEGGRLWPWAMLAGCGLTFAMLCRPMTAAGVGLPFGLWFGGWVMTGKGSRRSGDVEQESGVREQESGASEQESERVLHGVSRTPLPDSCLRTSDSWPDRLRTAAAMSLPLAVGFVGLFFYNRAITGDGFVTPYQQYTDIYTPRHVYGFNNVVRGEQRLGPKVVENYDEWAENLTPSLAMSNVKQRMLFSLRWTWGIVPLAIAAIVFLLTIDRWSGDWWLIAAAIASLHAVHVPYWFEGIMGWHYVFESAPFWLLIFAGVTGRLWRSWQTRDRQGMCAWWSMLILTGLAVNLVTIEPIWPARLDVGIAEVTYPRQKYRDFYAEVAQLTNGRRSLVLIEADPADRHMHYVVNSPALDGQILYGQFQPAVTDTREVVEQFPDRDIWLIRMLQHDVRQVSMAKE